MFESYEENEDLQATDIESGELDDESLEEVSGGRRRAAAAKNSVNRRTRRRMVRRVPATKSGRNSRSARTRKP